MIAGAVISRNHLQNLVLIGLGLGLLLVAMLSLAKGAYTISFSQVAFILFDQIGLGSQEINEAAKNVLLQIRLPRILLSVLIGGGLGIAGAALQGMFRNPLVEPGLIGVSSGSALFAVVFIVFLSGWIGGFPILERLGLPFAAFLGGLIHVLAVYQLSRSQGKTDTATLILAGVAINALAGALIGLTLFFADDTALRSFTFWSLGDLGAATWSKFPLALLLIGLPSILLLTEYKNLNALSLGEREAFHMGIEVQKVKLRLLILSALIVGVGVSIAGMIGFIGLIVPHLIRIGFGANHRLVLPASFLLGAILLNFADLIARTAVSPAELPIGVLTALIGAPFFIYLIFKLNLSKK
ncbi:iron complex transport system permease protein [Algoriphagus faecimaris]|uniref:Iron complex transport system permease protein n=1 Tax=Algoriphagus faecimaris TaxID=686796 RepID=A0A1G6X6R7_9BACT|nr:iron chelate uptake ABC transporter family permease subunit [Algoriphagus faecimaris]SDD73851.1 iron complex transport system permease protein [Algoriphagus faecimaris]